MTVRMDRLALVDRDMLAARRDELSCCGIRPAGAGTARKRRSRSTGRRQGAHHRDHPARGPCFLVAVPRRTNPFKTDRLPALVQVGLIGTGKIRAATQTTRICTPATPWGALCLIPGFDHARFQVDERPPEPERLALADTEGQSDRPARAVPPSLGRSVSLFHPGGASHGLVADRQSWSPPGDPRWEGGTLRVVRERRTPMPIRGQRSERGRLPGQPVGSRWRRARAEGVPGSAVMKTTC
jgi:hypothetical protein